MKYTIRIFSLIILLISLSDTSEATVVDSSFCSPETIDLMALEAKGKSDINTCEIARRISNSGAKVSCDGIYTKRRFLSNTSHAFVEENGTKRIVSYVFNKFGKLKFVKTSFLKNTDYVDFSQFNAHTNGVDTCTADISREYASYKRSGGSSQRTEIKTSYSKPNSQHFVEESETGTPKRKRSWRNLFTGWSVFKDSYKFHDHSRLTHVGVQRSRKNGRSFQVGPSWDPSEGTPYNHGITASIKREF